MGLQPGRVSTWSPVCSTLHLSQVHFYLTCVSDASKHEQTLATGPNKRKTLANFICKTVSEPGQGKKVHARRVRSAEWPARAWEKPAKTQTTRSLTWRCCLNNARRGLGEVTGQCGGTGSAIIYDQNSQWGDSLFLIFQIRGMVAAACWRWRSHGNNQSPSLFLHGGEQTISLSWTDCVQINDLTGLLLKTRICCHLLSDCRPCETNVMKTRESLKMWKPKWMRGAVSITSSVQAKKTRLRTSCHIRCSYLKGSFNIWIHFQRVKCYFSVEMSAHEWKGYRKHHQQLITVTTGWSSGVRIRYKTAGGGVHTWKIWLSKQSEEFCFEWLL